MIKAWRDATNETTTRTLWSAAMRLEAVHKGASAETVRKNPRIRQIMHRAFIHGEPVWMAADEVAFVSKELDKKRHPTPAEEIRAARALWYTHGPGRSGGDARRRRHRRRR